MSQPLWFYWGEKTMSFLRYMTLRSACRIHDDVTLIIRNEPAEVSLKWIEKQDFMFKSDTKNWYDDAVKLPLKIVYLDDIAPEIANLRADGVHTSDLLSWWILAQHGGTVCDMDIVFLKPLPKIQNNVEVVRYRYTCMNVDYFPIAYMQGHPDPKWKLSYDNAMRSYDPNVYQSCGAENLRPYPEPILPSNIVYPWVKYRWGTDARVLFSRGCVARNPW